MRPSSDAPSAWREAWWTRHVGLIVGTLCGIAVLGPVLFSRGFLLRYDLVFVPHLPFSPTTLGTAGQVPRAVPNDAVVALFDTVLPGDVTQKAILLGAFVAIGAGADRWRAGVLTRAVAAVLLCWNPWIAERLSIGHWGYLWGFAATVWAFVGAMECREQQRDSQHGSVPERLFAVPASVAPRGTLTTVLVALLLGAASGSTGAVLVALTLLVVMQAPGPGRLRARRMWPFALAWLVLDAPWWFPFLTVAPSGAADADGVRAFSASADGAGGFIVALLGGGGIWHAPSWLPERASWPIALASAALLILGVVTAARRPASGPVVLLAGLGLILGGAGAVPVARDVITAVVLHVPGGGLLRDGQKFVALWVVPAAFGVALAVDALRRRGAGTIMVPIACVAGLVAPVALLPSLAWAHRGEWSASSYPSSWTADARAVDARGGRVAVLPWSTYRRYAWNDDVVVLDPWNRLLTRDVVSDDSLALRRSGREVVVAGESDDGARIGAALAKASSSDLGRALTDAYVRTVVVQTDQPEADEQERTLLSTGARLLRSDDAGHVHLYALDGIAAPAAEPAWRLAGLVCGGLAAAVVLGRLVRPRFAARTRRRR